LIYLVNNVANTCMLTLVHVVSLLTSLLVFFLVLPFLQASEKFLQQMVSLYVASHYKNTPNDLLLMADAPAHHMFALLGPVDESQVGEGS